MDVSFRRSPHQTELVQLGSDVGKSTRREVVVVVGEQPNGVGIAGRGGNSGIEQHGGHRPNQRADERQRIRRLTIDVGGEQYPEVVEGTLHRRVDQGRLPRNGRVPEPSSQRVVDPPTEMPSQTGLEGAGVAEQLLFVGWITRTHRSQLA